MTPDLTEHQGQVLDPFGKSAKVGEMGSPVRALSIRTLKPWGRQALHLPRKATFTALGLGGHKMDTAVMTPRVPSDPMKSCFRS